MSDYCELCGAEKSTTVGHLCNERTEIGKTTAVDHAICKHGWLHSLCDECKLVADLEDQLRRERERIASGYYDKECRETLAESTKERFELQTQVTQLQTTVGQLRACLSCHVCERHFEQVAALATCPAPAKEGE